MVLTEVADEDVPSLLFLLWNVTNKPPDPGRSENLSIHGEKNLYLFFGDLTFNTGERTFDIFYRGLGLSVWSYYHSVYEGYSFLTSLSPYHSNTS